MIKIDIKNTETYVENPVNSKELFAKKRTFSRSIKFLGITIIKNSSSNEIDFECKNDVKESKKIGFN